MNLELADISWTVIAPPLVLLVIASMGLLIALYTRGSRYIAQFSMLGIITAAIFNLQLLQSARSGNVITGYGLRYLGDIPAAAFGFIILLGTLLAVLISYDYLERAELEHPEYYPLILLSACGALVMAAAGDLITLIIGLEIMSLAVYVLAAWRQNARESEEAGMKYFLLGAFASAFFIYGIALMYGASGSFVYADIAATLGAEGFSQRLYAALGGVMILAGLGFKVALAPFHQWAPDVYTGAPTSVTAFMSVVVKTAAFAALLRIFASFMTLGSPLVMQVLAVLIAVTLVIGNFSALAQRGVKRMLAYSAVAHAGYLGLAVLAAGEAGMQAAIWYLMAYTLMNAGAFGVLTLLSDKNDYGDALERFAGLGKAKPWLAFAMTIFLLSLAGIPLMAGFVGKILVFQAAISAGYVWLAVIAIATSIVAVFYYLRPVQYMYFREAEYEPFETESRATHTAIAIAVVGTILLGLFPNLWYGMLHLGQQVLAGF